MKPARYFPVSTEPLRMKADLLPFGTDFGNGQADSQFFQVDDERPRYLAAKAAVPRARHQLVEEPALTDVHAAALEWFHQTLEREHPGLLQAPRTGPLFERYHGLLSQVQEDAALVHRGGGAGRGLLMHVCFPSGWRPERLGNADFMGIHRPVPGFSGERLGRSMIDAMIDRGPYVRFVWTLSADDFLDHHPEQGRRLAWTPETPQGWLRVERQVTVPLRQADAAVFLIRTYLYPLDSLGADQREVLRTALERMPDDIATYKNLLEGRPRMLELLS